MPTVYWTVLSKTEVPCPWPANKWQKSYSILIICQKTSWIVISRCIQKFLFIFFTYAMTKTLKGDDCHWEPEVTFVPHYLCSVCVVDLLLYCGFISIRFLSKALKFDSPISLDIKSYGGWLEWHLNSSPTFIKLVNWKEIFFFRAHPFWGSAYAVYCFRFCSC